MDKIFGQLTPAPLNETGPVRLWQWLSSRQGLLHALKLNDSIMSRHYILYTSRILIHISLFLHYNSNNHNDDNDNNDDDDDNNNNNDNNIDNKRIIMMTMVILMIIIVIILVVTQYYKYIHY